MKEIIEQAEVIAQQFDEVIKKSGIFNGVKENDNISDKIAALVLGTGACISGYIGMENDSIISRQFKLLEITISSLMSSIMKNENVVKDESKNVQ